MNSLDLIRSATAGPLSQASAPRSGPKRHLAIALLRHGLLAALLLAAAWLAVLPDQAAAHTETTLVSNLDQTESSSRWRVGPSGANKFALAQQFTTGSNTEGYTLTAVVLNFLRAVSPGKVQVSIYSNDPDGNRPDASQFTLTNPTSIPAGQATFTVPGGQALSANTKYHVVVEGSPAATSTFALRSTDETLEDDGALTGWSIRDNLWWRNVDGGSWKSGSKILFIGLKGYIGFEDPVWSTTITVGEAGLGARGYDGVSEHFGSIGQDEFTIGSRTLQVVAVFAGPHDEVPSDYGFYFQLFPDPDRTLQYPDEYTLEFAGEMFPLSEASYIGNYSFWFRKPWVADNAATLDEDNYDTTLPVGTTVGVCLRTDAQICPDTSPLADINRGPPGAVRFKQISRRVDEGQTVTVTLALDSVRTYPAAVRLTTEPGDHTGYAGYLSADDYSPAVPERLIIPAGQRSASFDMHITDDDVGEPDEALLIKAHVPSGWSVDYPFMLVKVPKSDRRRAAPRLPHMWVNDASEKESGHPDNYSFAFFEVRLKPAWDDTVQVDFATEDVTATAGEDYMAESGTLTFPPGETFVLIPITILDDEVEDDGERFKLKLSNMRGAPNGWLTDDEATGTIHNTEPLTASFASVPASHTGEPFTFDLIFSEDVTGLGHKTLRNDAFTVTNGAVTEAGRADPNGADPNKEWEITVAPDGNADVTITLPETTDCTATGAICIGDRPLSEPVSETVAGPAVTPALNVSDASGSPTISGTTQVGEALTADTSGISDADGLDNVAYQHQWIRSDGDGDSEISEATSETYTLVEADQGKTIKVKVSFTDDAGNDEELTSAATGTVAARPNRAATGAPTISGTAQVGQTLAAGTSGISDADGLTNVSYSYQWISNDGTSDSDISGSTGSTYTLVDADQGNTIKVKVTFTDDRDNDESLTSDATGEVAAAPSPLTVRLDYEPSSHNGTGAFTFEVRFSEESPLSFRTLRDHAFTMSGGEIKKAKRLEKGSNIGWTITVEPDGNGNVEIVLPITADCSDSGAICTEDGRKLSNKLEFTVSGPSG